jgi:hypothetical protein
MSYDVFLAAHGWADATHEPLAGDASARRYIRLYSGQKRAILMIDPQDDTARFTHISNHLRGLGLSAPEIYAQDAGLMLLEDFGNAQFAQVAKSEPNMEIPLYQAATDVVCHLETCGVPAILPRAAPDTLAQMVEPAFTHYLPLLQSTGMDAKNDILARLADLLAAHIPNETVLVLRDYHAENMIWMPERNHLQRVGLLDFQDALVGPPIYDLVSLLQDARRDVTSACHKATLRHYLDRSGRSEDAVIPAFHLLGLQRNLRILGIFARLASERGKPGYLGLIPRVWGHIQTSLATPVARDIAPLINGLFPEPTPDRLGQGALT